MRWWWVQVAGRQATNIGMTVLSGMLIAPLLNCLSIISCLISYNFWKLSWIQLGFSYASVLLITNYQSMAPSYFEDQGPYMYISEGMRLKPVFSVLRGQRSDLLDTVPHQWMNQWINEWMNQSINESINQSIKQASKQAMNQSIIE